MLKDRKNKGITLVALVITIVILLILAGISISTLTNTGIFQKVKDAKGASENAEKEQRQTLSEYEREFNKYTAQELTDDKINKVLSETENIVLKDANGNIFTLPAGFKVVVNDDTGNAKTVDKGIVIEDATDLATEGSQFVWVPVGKIYTDVERTEKNAKTITLGRYDFDTETGVESEYTGDYIEENVIDKSTLKNCKEKAIAKNIEEFKNSVLVNCGYYIGRYEARTTVVRNNKEDMLAQITEKGIDPVYNYVTQQQAASKSQNMYSSNKFTSDLMNSFAWDTAITFIQGFTNQKNYAYKLSVNKKDIALMGTNDETRYNGVRDVECNIWDMSSNEMEWTTETSNFSDKPCIARGGFFNSNEVYTSVRNSWSRYETFHSDIGSCFRPILYINN